MDKNELKNPEMYKLAKEEGELSFAEAIKKSCHAPISLVLVPDGSAIDKSLHVDCIMLEYDSQLKCNVLHFIDVKDLEEKNFNTGNYVLRKSFVEFHTEIAPDPRYFTAFRLAEDGHRTSKFILVNTQEMLHKCILKKMSKGESEFFLLPIAEVYNKCKFRIIEEEAF